MNDTYDMFALDAISKKLNEIKDTYSTFDFKSTLPNDRWYQEERKYCRELIFYVPELNAIFSTNTKRTFFDDFCRRGGIASLQPQQMKKITNLDRDYNWNYKIFFDHTLVDDFLDNNRYSGLENFIQYYSSKLCQRDIVMYALCYLENPCIEKLFQVGLKDFVRNWVFFPSALYKRNFKNGNNMNEITKLPKYAWQMMLKENVLTTNINAWNEMRIWIKKENLSKEHLQSIFNLNLYDSNHIKELRTILTATWEGKKIFSLESLLNYLERVDMYQAIGVGEALPILRDYIVMCRDLNIRPITDSNSLKREHDVTVRQYNEHKNFKHDKMLEAGFNKRHAILSKYEYSDGRLQVIAPKCAEDVRMEGRNNRNCVGSYVDRVAKGQTNIFFIRNCVQPEKSYITIEINDDFSKVRQQYYGANRPIDRQEDLDFIQDWLQHNALVHEQTEDIEIDIPSNCSLDAKIQQMKQLEDKNHTIDINTNEPQMAFDL